MKIVNLKIMALKYKLVKLINDSLEKDKIAIKNGAKTTFSNYAKIQIINCQKTSFDKSKIQKLCDTYDIDISTLEKTTNYQRIDIDNISNNIVTNAENIAKILQLI